MRHTCHRRDPGRDDYLTSVVILGPTLVLGKGSPNWRLEAGTLHLCVISTSLMTNCPNLRSDGGVAVLILDGCQKSVQQIHFKTKFLTTLLQWFRNKVLQIVKENSNCNWYLPPNKSRPAIVLWIRPLWQPASSPPCTLNQSTRGLGLHHVNILPFNGFPFFPSEIQYKR